MFVDAVLPRFAKNTKGSDMAKKTGKPAKKITPLPIDPNFVETIGPLAEPAHLLHKIILDASGHQIACSFTKEPIAGTSDEEYAFNLTPGFAYTVVHKVRHDKRCEWIVIQGPYHDEGERGGRGVSGGNSCICYGPNYHCSLTCKTVGYIPNCSSPTCVPQP